MRLIDADKLKEKCPTNLGAPEWLIDMMPPVDAEPVRHGKWINDNGLYKCTACNDLCTVAGWANCIPEKQIYKVFKYCPNCGARMEISDE